MFDRRRRVESLMRGATAILEPGETITDVVQVSAGTKRAETAFVADGLLFTPSYPVRARFYALIVTDRNVCAVALPNALSNRPSGILFKWPVTKVCVRRNGNRLYVREDAQQPERGFELLPLFGKRADQLMERVATASAVSREP